MAVNEYSLFQGVGGSLRDRSSKPGKSKRHRCFLGACLSVSVPLLPADRSNDHGIDWWTVKHVKHGPRTYSLALTPVMTAISLRCVYLSLSALVLPVL